MHAEQPIRQTWPHNPNYYARFIRKFTNNVNINKYQTRVEFIYIPQILPWATTQNAEHIVIQVQYLLHI
jgi:hypothetical protein